ncbi:glycosyltransferase family 2 protein [Psychroserpens damuponensis]|uniref:glycosyltransferase family 2 protein n=1 Tax=Psychroserpens damuponensis TaxID=943936 RepID=UPI000693352A|nr:glycosyltransferase family 2 protein [Psychroserpens damuponensis]
MTPYFSVVIPLYNKAQEISETISSVLAQTFTNFEVIIVNDGSTDDSLNKVEKFNDQRIRIFTTQNKGVSHARNYGIQHATSQFIAFLDGDDIWKPHHLQDLKSLIESYPNCGLYCKAYNKIKGQTIIDSQYKDLPKHKKWSGVIDDYFYHSSINSLASSSSIAINKSVFESIGFFNEAYDSGEDTDLWIRIALQFPTAFDNNVSVTHNLNANHQLTNSLFSGRQHFNLNAFKNDELKNLSLKTYLDLNRYAIAIQYKLEKEFATSKTIYKSIDVRNLSRPQKLIYKCPIFVIKSMLSFRDILRLSHINLRLFR